MPNKQLFEAMKKANERGSLMSCAINVWIIFLFSFTCMIFIKQLKYK